MSRLHDHRQKRKAPPGRGGASKIDRSGGQIEWPKYITKSRLNSTRPDAVYPPNLKLIRIDEACRCSGEKPAIIIRWCVHDKIGKHVKTGRVGAWMVDAGALERLLAERGTAA